jgi:hypothetical protein
MVNINLHVNKLAYIYNIENYKFKKNELHNTKSYSLIIFYKFISNYKCRKEDYLHIVILYLQILLCY